MNENLLIYLRQEVTRKMPVIDYDKATINAAIESAFISMENGQIPGNHNGISTEQSSIVNTVVKAVCFTPQPELEAIDKITPIYDETKAIFSAMLKPIRDNIEASYPDNTPEENEALVKAFLTKFIN